MVVKSRLEPGVDPLFHPDSYGYRPGKSALDAVGQARQRCWRFDWIIDLDIKGFFDNIPQDLLIRAVKKHAKEQWIVLYIERWLKAPVQEENGQLVPREKGTPQGGVISPLLANLFLHYAFDRWMAKRYPQLPFERYRRRCHRALQNGEGSPGGSGSHSRTLEGVWAGASSGEDEGCLLQG